MTVANEPSVILNPVPIGINAIINLLIYSDERQTTLVTFTTETVTCYIKDPGGTWYTYSGTKDLVAGVRNAYITLTSSQHTTAGTAEIRVFVDGQMCYPRYQFDFIEEAA